MNNEHFKRRITVDLEREMEEAKKELAIKNKHEQQRQAAECEESDSRGPAIVVEGSVLSGFKFYGPFNSIDDAIGWCENFTLDGAFGVGKYVVVLLEPVSQ